jgi:hypothetical protein
VDLRPRGYDIKDAFRYDFKPDGNTEATSVELSERELDELLDGIDIKPSDESRRRPKRVH